MLDIKIFTCGGEARRAGKGHYQFRKMEKTQKQYPF